MVGLACNFTAGWLGQKWPMQRLIGIGMGALALSLAGLPMVTTALHVDLCTRRRWERHGESLRLYLFRSGGRYLGERI